MKNEILDNLVQIEKDKKKKPLFIEIFKNEKDYNPLKELETEKGKRIAKSIRNLK